MPYSKDELHPDPRMYQQIQDDRRHKMSTLQHGHRNQRTHLRLVPNSYEPHCHAAHCLAALHCSHTWYGNMVMHHHELHCYAALHCSQTWYGKMVMHHHELHCHAALHCSQTWYGNMVTHHELHCHAALCCSQTWCDYASS